MPRSWRPAATLGCRHRRREPLTPVRALPYHLKNGSPFRTAKRVGGGAMAVSTWASKRQPLTLITAGAIAALVGGMLAFSPAGRALAQDALDPSIIEGQDVTITMWQHTYPPLNEWTQGHIDAFIGGESEHHRQRRDRPVRGVQPEDPHRARRRSGSALLRGGRLHDPAVHRGRRHRADPAEPPRIRLAGRDARGMGGELPGAAHRG